MRMIMTVQYFRTNATAVNHTLIHAILEHLVE